MMTPFLLLAPTLSESAPIRAAVADGLARGELELSVCGIGQMCATSLCERLDRTGWLGCIALIGWAGGLRLDLAAGDVVLADAALNVLGQCRWMMCVDFTNFAIICKNTYVPRSLGKATHALYNESP